MVLSTRSRDCYGFLIVRDIEQNLFGSDSDVVPPESISNSVVKRISADGSVGGPMRE